MTLIPHYKCLYYLDNKINKYTILHSINSEFTINLFNEPLKIYQVENMYKVNSI